MYVARKNFDDFDILKLNMEQQISREIIRIVSLLLCLKQGGNNFSGKKLFIRSYEYLRSG